MHEGAVPTDFSVVEWLAKEKLRENFCPDEHFEDTEASEMLMKGGHSRRRFASGQRNSLAVTSVARMLPRSALSTYAVEISEHHFFRSCSTNRHNFFPPRWYSGAGVPSSLFVTLDSTCRGRGVGVNLVLEVRYSVCNNLIGFSCWVCFC